MPGLDPQTVVRPSSPAAPPSAAHADRSPAAAHPAAGDPSPTSAAWFIEQRENSPVSELLERPPSFVTRGLLYLLLALLAVALVYSAVSRVDIIRTEPAVIIPPGHVRSIQPDIDGLVTEIAVREGERVAEGQILAVVESKEVGGYLAQLRAAEARRSEGRDAHQQVLPLKKQQIATQQDVLRIRLAGLREAREALSGKLADERRSMELARTIREAEIEREVEEHKRLKLEADNVSARFELWKKELATTSRLRERGIVSELQFLATQRGYEEAAATVEKAGSLLREAEKSAEIARMKFAALELEHQRTLADLTQQLAQNQHLIDAASREIEQQTRELELLALQADRDLRQTEFDYEQVRAAAELNLHGVTSETLEQIATGQARVNNQSVLRAPTAGTVGKLLVRNTGVPVNRGQTLVTLIPEGDPLVAEIRVSHQNVGLIKPGLPVRLKFDAFPFAEYGAIHGELSQIVPDAETDAVGGSFYRAYCTLSQDYFRVEGRRVPLLPGMTAAAEIVTERKTLLELVLSPFLELREPEQAAP